MRTFKRKEGSGRPTVLSTNDKRRITSIALHHPTWSPGQIKRHLSLRPIARTISNDLKKNNFVRRSVKPKPALEEAQKVERVKWAREKLNQDFSHVVFVDEASFWSNTYKKKVLVKKGQRPTKYVPSHGFKVHVWGAISLFGKVGFHTFTESFKAKTCCKILENILLPGVENSIEQYYGDDWSLMQDNHPVHTSDKVMKWVSLNAPHYIKMPGYSPDLNPMENIWGIMKTKIQEMEIESVGSLERAVQETWENVTLESIQNCVSSMNNRCEMIIESEGSPIDY